MLLRFLCVLLLCISSVSYGCNTVLVLGDSISSGYGIDPKQGWVALLQQRLNKIKPGVKVVNASISGYTTSNGLSVTPNLLKQHQPDLLILALGGNDGLRGLSLQAMQDNLSKIVSLAQTQSKVLLIGIRIPPNYGQAYTSSFAQSFKKVAELHRIALVPQLLANVGDQPELMQQDGIHPNQAAQSRLLDNIWPTLAPMLNCASSAKDANDT